MMRQAMCNGRICGGFQENGIGTHDVSALSEDHGLPIDPFAVDAERPHRPDKMLQQPDPGPFTNGIRQCSACRNEIGDKHIIHIGSVVHHKDHSSFRINFGYRCIELTLCDAI